MILINLNASFYVESKSILLLSFVLYYFILYFIVDEILI